MCVQHRLVVWKHILNTIIRGKCRQTENGVMQSQISEGNIAKQETVCMTVRSIPFWGGYFQYFHQPIAFVYAHIPLNRLACMNINDCGC